MKLALLLGCGEPSPPAPPPPPPVAAPAEERAVVVKPALRDPKWAGARCNDGTPFAYAIRPGRQPTWVVNLSGGYFCEDERQLCSERRSYLTTTLPQPDGAAARMKHVGLFSTDPAQNPTFADATFVDAHYCSSDLWLGDSLERRACTGSPDGWYFSGRENVRALLDALRELHGLDDALPSTRILVVGTSAGGAGVVGNLDAVVAAFPRAAAEGRLKVVLDGSWVPPLPPDVPLPDAARWGPVHPACDADLRARGEPVRNCVYGPVWWPYVARTGVPVLVQLSGLDRTQTPVFGIDTPEETEAWRRNVRASLEPLPWVFSSGQPYHVVAIEDLWSKGPPGRTFRELVGRFWADEPAERIFLRYDEPVREGRSR